MITHLADVAENDLQTIPTHSIPSGTRRAEAKRNKDNQESKKRGRATYTGGSRSMVQAKERVRARIEESSGSSIGYSRDVS
ncbi:uncharacterized protein A4U43_C03F26550 [Asparagus officinalis]|uniref:Uncharacterized protein n=1 Tax=Asparagus officinalis TaxID=4686 RepID=A0A5P1FD90_ASPOF|nr:uncharacterized protein A4U43_C03F26550 [Asparagus officinalis]